MPLCSWLQAVRRACRSRTAMRHRNSNMNGAVKKRWAGSLQPACCVGVANSNLHGSLRPRNRGQQNAAMSWKQGMLVRSNLAWLPDTDNLASKSGRQLEWRIVYCLTWLLRFAVALRTSQAGGWQTNTETDCNIWWRLDGGSFIDLQWLFKLGMFHGIWREYDASAWSWQQINTSQFSKLCIYFFLAAISVLSFLPLSDCDWPDGSLEKHCVWSLVQTEKRKYLTDKDRMGAPAWRLCRVMVMTRKR